MSLTIGDDLRGVLEDLAASPRQTLFGGTLHQRLQLAMNAEPTAIGANPTGLSKVERHLVAMHRRELAKVLNQAFYAEFFKPTGPAGLFRAAKEPCSKSAWNSKARATRDLAPHEAFTDGSGKWLHRLLDGQSLDSPVAFQSLLAASLRLSDSPRTRLFSGVAHQASESDAQALAVLSSLSRRAPDPEQLTALRCVQAISAKHGPVLQTLRLSFRALKLLEHSGREKEFAIEVATLAYRHSVYHWPFDLPDWVHDHAVNHRVAFEREFEHIRKSTGSSASNPWLPFKGARS